MCYLSPRTFRYPSPKSKHQEEVRGQVAWTRRNDLVFTRTQLTARPETLTLAGMRSIAVCLLVSALLPSLSRAQEAPVFVITPIESSIKFDVQASVAINGTFDKWNATLTFASPDVSTGVLDVKIQAATVDTGSGLKNSKLKGPDFFDAANNPLITFRSTKLVQTVPTPSRWMATLRFAESPDRRS